ncbi:segregation and condensation protein B [Friedmanniella endophytica]|uniref:Segregation and condensation protein B n=1 Tax=Microlunatus kandeliicorticis TaxID=1759536 RepID=A0A7W3IU37_9ACTN|nr:SMC-Scp complex subunit ScpB [Microlunatus kandeliicorticis]MBA8795259.1 segregation and condensation protein B [Microlunatus kandeliicorticis]
MTAPDEPGVEQQETLVDAEPPRELDRSHLGPSLEALLLVADEPLTETTLAQLLEVPIDVVREELDALVEFYTETGRGFELRALAGGWRFYTREEHADLVSRYVLEGQTAKLSQAALETLAVIAYLQPVSRARVSGVRGVNVDGVIRTLLTRELITEVGVDEHSGATLFGTTPEFCERMGLSSLDELPPLAPNLPDVTELEAELSQLTLVRDESAPAPEPSPGTGDGPDEAPAGVPSDVSGSVR